MADLFRQLLSEGLDLCVRARKLDAQDRANTFAEMCPDFDVARRAERHNAAWPDQPMASRSATIPIWVQDQYERDLADWERRARAALSSEGGERDG